ncbi:MAG: hypothetical protein HC881_05605 [Leptolyngbyaceae cyanobacterium SL_7_1]|nr:hypothetical protein [Leptolyngbyaceae cyanobacterium SL_7_1]
MEINQALEKLMGIEGALATALVDWTSGMSLGTAGGNAMFNVELAATANVQVVRAKLQSIKTLGLNDRIEDILITLGNQYHLIRPLQKKNKLFLYLALRRDQANLALSRYKLAEIESKLEL